MTNKHRTTEDHGLLLRPFEPPAAPTPTQRFFKRFGTLLIALFLLFLLLVYLAPGYDLLSVLEGKAASDVVVNHQLTLSDGRTIIFTPEVFTQLKTLYFENQHQEFSACLLGSQTATVYTLDRLILPRTYEQDVFHVRADLCPKETVIALHSHPYKHCIFSAADINYYQAFAKINKDGLIGVMCEPDRFGFYP
ncbi:hypothetical protein J4208_00895 [Candidatus Woesearchaeota archaeon]|nr:hypothetical protein [Candidatus Woesearchaeota archaeon]